MQWFASCFGDSCQKQAWTDLFASAHQEEIVYAEPKRMLSLVSCLKNFTEEYMRHGEVRATSVEDM